MEMPATKKQVYKVVTGFRFQAATSHRLKAKSHRLACQAINTQSFAVSLHIFPTGQNLDGSFPGSGQAGIVCPNAAVDNSHSATAKIKFLFIAFTLMAAL